MKRPTLLGHCTTWTAAQDDYLRLAYPNGDTFAIAAALGRACSAIYARTKALRLRKNPEAIANSASTKTRQRSAWNDALDEIVTLMYPDSCASHIEALTGIDADRIAIRASELGLRKTAAYLADTQRQRMANMRRR